MAYEEPDYEVVKTFPEFELTQNAPYVVAETVGQGNFSDVGNQAFRRLFAYINEEKRPQGTYRKNEQILLDAIKGQACRLQANRFLLVITDHSVCCSSGVTRF